MKKRIFTFLFDGFSDWEISYLTPEIKKKDQFELIYFSKDGNSITSMGGLHIKPVASLSNLSYKEIDMLILPGGTAWEKGDNDVLSKITRDVFTTGRPVAAICGATTYLGQLGILDNLKHTSNDMSYLEAIAPNYCGHENYQNTLAVTDENLITASGIAPIEFAREVFRYLELFPREEIENWFQLFKHGIWTE